MDIEDYLCALELIGLGYTGDVFMTCSVLILALTETLWLLLVFFCDFFSLPTLCCKRKTAWAINTILGRHTDHGSHL